MIKKFLPIILCVFFATSALAQLEVGASYELRDQEPQSGFGIRLQSGIFNAIPVVNLGLRAHFSYFSETNNVDETTFNYDKTIENYDFGLAAYGGIQLGLLEPYIGAGLGSETVDLSAEDFSNPPPPGSEPNEEEESNIYWNTFVGAKVTVIPLVKPFVEYRFSSRELDVPDLNDKTGRIIFGVVLSF
jgi:prolipoprotein diacylglyceryltransferase